MRAAARRSSTFSTGLRFASTITSPARRPAALALLAGSTDVISAPRTPGSSSAAASSSGSHKWETLREAFETKHNFLLFIADRQMYIFPKKCFDNEEQIRAFKELLRERLGPKAKVKG